MDETTYLLTDFDNWNITFGGLPKHKTTVIIVPDEATANQLSAYLLPRLKKVFLVDLKKLIHEVSGLIRTRKIKLAGLMDINLFEANLFDNDVVENQENMLDPSQMVVYINDLEYFFQHRLMSQKKEIKDYIDMKLTTVGILYRRPIPFREELEKEMDAMCDIIMELKRVTSTFIEVEVYKDYRGMVSEVKKISLD